MLIVGKITAEIKKSIPFLQIGNIIITTQDLEHIEKSHGKQIKKAGFHAALDFIKFVLGHVEIIYTGNHEQSFVLINNQLKPRGQAVISLFKETNQNDYKVITSHPVKPQYYENKTPLWGRAPTNHFKNILETPGAISGQSDYVDFTKDIDSNQ
ncbi:hypothetical protein RDn1_273 [Candidatus Termititenax dinenymphae]|uniref:Uncharacterized protein n=1 Tax=Candidatus Termititenax dinenymphae TaxID=2218523 RepID=A0A388TLV2_9BACT|nr:hypothetical protein RDn1_273 [Candidatus Termititenax dinenymphae]